MKLESAKSSGLAGFPLSSVVKIVFMPSREGYCFLGQNGFAEEIFPGLLQDIALDASADEPRQRSHGSLFIGVDPMNGVHLRFDVAPDDVRMLANISSRRCRTGMLVDEAELGKIGQDGHASFLREDAGG